MSVTSSRIRPGVYKYDVLASELVYGYGMKISHEVINLTPINL